jgi:NAD(P)-dependent dehydrogenase (short-subunit alcohol dehydrogenase family)
MDYQDRQVVITGGTSHSAAPSSAPCSRRAPSATSPIAAKRKPDASRIAHREHPNVTLVRLENLTDEAAVAAFYDRISPLWASINIAGGFAFAPIAGSNRALLIGQLESNLICAFLCSRSAVAAFRRGGGRRPHGQRRRAPSAGAAPQCRTHGRRS